MVADIQTDYNVRVRSTPLKPAPNTVKIVPSGTIFRNCFLVLDQKSKQMEWWRIEQDRYVHHSVVHVIDNEPDIEIPSKIDPMSMPYTSQHGPGAEIDRADCGPACLRSFLLRYLGLDISVNKLSAMMPNEEGYSTAQDLQRAATFYGLKMEIKVARKLIDLPTDRPSIPLVSYKGFKRIHVQDKKYMGLHWLIFLGFAENGSTITHDPNYWKPETGAFRQYDHEESIAAFEYNPAGITYLVVA